MSGKKTKTVYLMVECEVGEWTPGGDQEAEDRAITIIRSAIADVCCSQKNDGSFSVHGDDLFVIRSPVILPDDIKKILFRDSIRNLPIHKQLEAAVIRNGEKPAKEQWQALIDRGAINEKGEVLLKGPGCNDEDDA